MTYAVSPRADVEGLGQLVGGERVPFHATEPLETDDAALNWAGEGLEFAVVGPRSIPTDVTRYRQRHRLAQSVPRKDRAEARVSWRCHQPFAHFVDVLARTWLVYCGANLEFHGALGFLRIRCIVRLVSEKMIDDRRRPQ